MAGRRAALLDALRVGLLFAALSGGWILLSDVALEWLAADVPQYAALSRYKGLAYTLLLALLIGFLVYGRSRRQQELTDVLKESRIDPVTGLPSSALAMALLDERLGHAIRGGGRVCIALFDIQRMRRINRGIGRSAGNRLLRQVARRLRENMPRNGLLARLDADKFLLIAPDFLSRDGLARRVQVMVRQASEPMRVNGIELTVSLRAVVAAGPDQGRDATTLVDAADSALGTLRERRLRGVADAGQVEPLPDVHLELEADLRRAIANGELEVHFQGQYRIADGTLTGAEALVRWEHPQRGAIPPGDFVALAESCGLIEKLTEMVLARVCDQISGWQFQGLRVPRIAVNISGMELSDQGIVSRLRGLLKRYPRCAPHLELEITESRVMENAALSRRVLGELQTLGVAVAIDDFGTGYSSLSYLTQFPIDCLKIDRAFVRHADRYRDKQAVLGAIATLGHSLGLRVLAEGVETAEELRAVVDSGVGEAQGFHYCRPMPADEFLTRCLRQGLVPMGAARPVKDEPV